MEKIQKSDFPKMALSAKVLEKIWNNKSDDIWENYL